MTDTARPRVGTIAWCDLTVADAEAVRDFYREVAGWDAAPLDMGGYADYVMSPAGSKEGVAGVCHARGPNADIPPHWLVYIVVADVEKSAEACMRLGGSIVAGPREMGGGWFCVIRDQAGAVCALFQPAAG